MAVGSSALPRLRRRSSSSSRPGGAGVALEGSGGGCPERFAAGASACVDSRSSAGAPMASGGEGRGRPHDDRRGGGGRLRPFRPRRRSAPLAKRRRLVDQRLGARVEAREAKREPAHPLLNVGTEADHPTLAAHEHVPGREHQLESQHHALRPRLGPQERHARTRQRLQLLLEELVLRRVRARDADRDGGRRRARIVGHTGRIPRRPGAWRGGVPVLRAEVYAR